MGQARRKPTAAEEQAQAAQDVERIAQALYEAFQTVSIGLPVKERYRATVRRLLERDVIRPGKRPEVDPPLEGQTTIEEHL